MLKVKQILSAIMIFSLLFFRVAPALAQEAPSAPEAPTAPPPSEQSAPAPPSEPTPPPAPTSTDNVSTSSEQPNEEPVWSDDDEVDGEGNTSSSDSNSSSSSSPTASGQQSGNQTSDGQVGSTEINTGDATNTAGVSTIANTNTSAGVSGSGTGSVSVDNSGNGSDSTNTGSVGVVTNNDTIQNNSAVVSNDLDQTTVSGNNSTSNNVGDSSITTGDANTSGTVITAVNTNVDGVGVAEFSVLDDHIGDIVLDFSSGCIYGCDIGNLSATNSDNGTGSTNTSSIDQTTNNNTIQNNDAQIVSNLDLSSNSGDNVVDNNTNGDSLIETGDANVAGNALTFANNNLSGGAYFNFVYIYGDLIGDIILPEDYFTSAPCLNCGADLLASNTGNGSSSTNTASIDNTTNNNTFQTNDADIENNMLLSASTGSNSTSGNTGGDSSITSGDTNIDGQVLNVANSNVSGGDWWLVLINEAGNWIGKILGVPSSGGTYAGSDGTQFIVDENGIITAVNSGNGSNSTNDASVSNTTNNTTVQTNDAKIVNNLNLSANTGGNSASNNTGGNSEIKTGDANIIASIVNMVNNNFTGGGRLFVTVIDVFGSWVGDFVAPGYKKENNTTQAQGSSQSAQGGNPGNNNSSNGSSSNNNSQTSTTSIPQTSSQSIQNPKVTSGVIGTTNIVQVAAFQQENILGDSEIGSSEIGGKKTIKINLAWVLLGLPIALMLFGVRRKFLKSKSV